MKLAQFKPIHALTTIRVFGLLCQEHAHGRELTQADVQERLKLRSKAATRGSIERLLMMELIQSTGRVYDRERKRWTARYRPVEAALQAG